MSIGDKMKTLIIYGSEIDELRYFLEHYMDESNYRQKIQNILNRLQEE